VQASDNSTVAQRASAPGGGYRGVAAILVAITAGCLVGLFYGRTMWLASQGPQRALDRLSATRQQKEALAADAERLAEAAADPRQAARHHHEAARLRGQIPTIAAEIDRLQDVRDEALRAADSTRYRVAALVGQLTSFAGDLFLQVLKLLVIPLVVTSMICGITSLGDIRNVGRIGLWTLVYYMTTTAAAVVLGLMLVAWIQPGRAADDTFAYVTENVAAKQDTTALGTLLNVFRGTPGDPGSGMFPSNIFLAASNTNVLALIVFSMVFGGALTTLGARGRVAIDFFTAANGAVMQMVHAVMFAAPVGIFALVATNIAKNGGAAAFATELSRLGWYVGTVLLGLAVHFMILGALLWALTGRNPLRYTVNLVRALFTAMSTASSSATLPVTMECVEENNRVSNRSASFVLPLGATVNMDGTALYEAVAVVFIAQSLNLDLGTGELIVVFVTATLAAVGAAGIPEAGLVTMVMVLTAVGLPVSGMGTILAVDWFLDRMRTTVNVYGDAIGAGIIDRLVVSALPGEGRPA